MSSSASTDKGAAQIDRRKTTAQREADGRARKAAPAERRAEDKRMPYTREAFAAVVVTLVTFGVAYYVLSFK
eukprot:m51a1_g5384 putative C-tail anchored protein (72) ;mRNA; r:14415-14761